MERNENSQNGNRPTIIVNQTIRNRTNGIGIAGFVFALLAMVFCWVPVFSWILWVLGLILSFIGLFKMPRGLAIAGMVISCAGFILMITVFSALFAVSVAA